MEVVRAHLERIAAVGDRVHAIVTLFGRPSARRSSGGESPATASGISPIGHGSDTIFVRGLPDGMVQAQLRQIIALLAHQFPDHDPGKAADIAVDTLLSGMGRS
ncbi:hypothetical protein ACTXG6_37185 [Pseudonocardia sp. Cha107L01]|uniref:hypothetical protein n=1 Tax=Pseudonocardia sp. Cha107L01 TaxID=3457576 RepID=UPI00403EEAFB